MDLQKHKRSTEIQWGIQQTRADLERARNVQKNFDKFRANIQFTHEAEGNSVSFGSKKFDFKKHLKPLLEEVIANLEQNLKTLQDEFDAL